MGCLAIDPHDRFRAAETDQQPATILKLELEAICGDKLGHSQATQGLRICIEDHLFAAFTIAGKRRIDPIVEMFADLVKEHLEQLGWLLAGANHKIQEIEVCQDAVALRDISAERISAALF